MGSDRTGIQLYDNQDPLKATEAFGRLFWDDNLRHLFQIDDKGVKTDLVSNTSGAFLDIDSSLASIETYLVGNTYVLPNNTNFRFVDQVYNFGLKNLDFSHTNGCYFLSSSCLPTITYEGTGAFITNSAQGTLLNIERIFFSTPNGRVFNLTGNGGLGNSLISKLMILLDQAFVSTITDFSFLTSEFTVVINSVAGILATNVGIGNVRGPQFNANQNVGGSFLKMDGTGSLLKISDIDSRPGSNDSMFDLTTAYITSGALVNINGGVHIEDGSFFAAGSEDQTNPAIKSINVDNVPDSTSNIFGHFSGNATATVIVTQNVPVKINAGTGWDDILKERFTFSSDGRWTYTGLENTDISVTFAATVTPAGGSAKSVSTYFAKNGVVDLNTRGNVAASAGGQITNLAILSFVTGDYIEAFIENNSDTANITVEVASIRIP